MFDFPHIKWVPLLFCVAFALVSCDSVRTGDGPGIPDVPGLNDPPGNQNDPPGNQDDPPVTQTDDPPQVVKPFPWRKFVLDIPLFQYPVVESPRPQSGLRVNTDCVFSQREKTMGPQIDISFVSLKKVSQYRLDVAVTYQGFEKNQFASVWPLEEQKQFMVSNTSNFLQDTTSMIILGKSLFPKVSETITKAAPGRLQKGRNLEHTLCIRELAPGMAYRFRLATLRGKTWVGSKEFLVNVPICPIDQYLDRK